MCRDHGRAVTLFWPDDLHWHGDTPRGAEHVRDHIRVLADAASQPTLDADVVVERFDAVHVPATVVDGDGEFLQRREPSTVDQCGEARIGDLVWQPHADLL